MGITSFSKFSSNTLWRLVNTDDGDKTYVGQFVPDRVREDDSTEWRTVVPVGSASGITQWAGSSPREFQFNARIWASDSLTSVKETLEELRALMKRDDSLGRPPICIFNWGTEIEMRCVVTSIGRIRYDRIQSNGNIRGAWLRIQIREHHAFAFVETDPSKPEPETKIHPSKDGDTFESIAEREYGDAAKGVYLRQRHPEQHDQIDDGAKIHVYDRTNVAKQTLNPYSHVFRNFDNPGSPQWDKWETVFGLRNVTKFSMIIRV